ncbi:MAG TPA: N-acetyl-gamma-glutamyl-phosphate reductase [Candidatus Dormibacteraeota bacterium]|nr:N-acetyl-gamma-glutamyl-phosphate reductase [Candidatus Dormibacteraeota bacterium]
MASLGKAVRVGVAGATGYAGAGCVSLLLAHPDAQLVAVSSRSQAGRSHAAAYPGSSCDQVLVDSIDGADCELVISASAAGDAARQAADWLAKGAVVMDISADFRLHSASSFATWYGFAHPAPELLPQATLALPELRPEEIAGARLLALPGCFSTAAILACGPAAQQNLIEPEVVVDGKTGISGAGRNASAEYLFSELNESVKAYAVAGHRHQPEMEQVLAELSGAPFAVTFVPHLVPMTRGIQVTCYLRPRAGVTLDQLRSVYRERYQDEPFVRLADQPVPSKRASYTNICWISLAQQGGHIVASAVLDNLGRGASAQAIQVMNLRFGLDPQAGLLGATQWP